MYCGYSTEMSFSAALSKTLDGENLCKICEFIESSKASTTEKQVVLKVQKFDLMLQSFNQILTPPRVLALVIQSPPHSDLSSLVPEIPPPRLG